MFFKTKNTQEKAANLDLWLVVSTLLLLALSVLMVFSITAIPSQESFGDSTILVRKHLLNIFLGLIVFGVFSRLNINLLRKLAIPALLLMITTLLIVLLPGVGHTAGGAQRWFALGPLRVQPGEISKFIIVLYMATYIGRQHANMSSFVAGAMVPLLVTGIFAALLLLEPDFGSTVVILGVVFCQLLMASRLRHLLSIGMASAAGLIVLVLISPYRMKRFIAFLDPFNDPSSSGYQLIQSLIAVGSGGLTGTGLGVGKQKLYYLPAAHTDFIYAVIAEELGLIGALFVLMVFLVIAFRGFSIAKRLAPDPFLCSLAVGCTFLIILPAVLNIGVVLGMLPTKGMVLPFVAYGGTAMIVHLAIMGVMISLSKVQL